MPIFVRMVNGNTIVINVEPSESIDILKTKIQDKSGIPVRYQKLILEGKIIPNNSNVGEHSFQKHPCVHLLDTRNTGGGAAPDTPEMARRFVIKIFGTVTAHQTILKESAVLSGHPSGGNYCCRNFYLKRMVFEECHQEGY